MSEKVINDEMLGFIMRNASEFDGINLTYAQIDAVLALRESFLRTKGIDDAE